MRSSEGQELSKRAAGKAAAGSAGDGGEFKDHGELPAWNRGDMPAPVPFGWKAVLASIGPGIIMLGGSIGTGEWLTGPMVTVKFQGAMLWIATLAILGQSFLNCEVIRYALATGEPVFTGYLRTKPGPRFWAVTYLLCDFGMFLPTFAAALASMLVAAWLGQFTPVGPQHNNLIMLVGITACIFSFVLMLFGGKIYNTLLAAATFKVVWVLVFLLCIDLYLVTGAQWKTIFQGFFFPFNENGFIVPQGLTWKDWATIAGFAAFAGGGGLSNATLSNYSREKGWGMGAHVGSIPSAVGGANVELAPLGTVFRPTKEALQRWNAWWKYVLFDQYGIWVFGCFAGVMLPAAMSLRVISPDKLDPRQMASIQAHGVADAFPAYSQLFWVLTLITGFLIIWYTMVQALDHVTRRWTDILWTSSDKARDAAGGAGVKKIYYGILLTYLFVNCAVFTVNLWLGATPFQILILVSVTQGFATAVTAFHTWWVNRRFLPKPLQASWWRNAGLLFCGFFYLTMTSLAAYGQIRGRMDEEAAKKAQAQAGYIAPMNR
jgi:hypothetical protein